MCHLLHFGEVTNDGVDLGGVVGTTTIWVSAVFSSPFIPRNTAWDRLERHKYTAFLKFMNSVTHSFIHKYFLRASYVPGTVQKLGT